MSQATGYHPTYIAAWLDVENAQTPEERANRAAMMSRAPGDAFEQYSGNSQRQYETAQLAHTNKARSLGRAATQADAQMNSG